MCHRGKQPSSESRGEQISHAGLKAAVGTCVTPRKYLQEGHAGETASTIITSDHESDLLQYDPEFDCL